MQKIVDLHMHVVPGVDDGARSIEESLQMLKLAESQGVTDVFCTSHNGTSQEDGGRYLTSLSRLKDAVQETKINVRLHKGCEILCTEESINDIIHGLDIGTFSTLGDSKYVLTELYSDTKPTEALTIIQTLIRHGYKPIIAHMERNDYITGATIPRLIQSGALIQVNAFSFVEESNPEIRARAQDLLRNQYIHFIGSDAHRIDHRPPSLSHGVRYILENTSHQYTTQILHKNLVLLLEQ